MSSLRRHAELIRALRLADKSSVFFLILLLAFRNLVPAASAVLTAALVSRIGEATEKAGYGSADLVVALALTLLVGHLADAFVEPVGYRVRTRVDGAHRTAIAALVAESVTITDIDHKDVQDLIRIASADPQIWTEKTPGDGAVAQLEVLLRWVGVLSTAAVLTRFAWWLAPTVVIPAVLIRLIRRRGWLSVSRLWAEGLSEGRQSDYWRDASTSPAEAKELRVFGFGDWAVERSQRHLRAMFGPLWRRGLQVQRQQIGPFLIVLAVLAFVYATVSAGVVAGVTAAAVQAAVLAATWNTFTIIGGAADAFDVEGGLRVLAARDQLRDRLGRSAASVATAGVPASGQSCVPPLVEFRDVSFVYQDSAKPVLNHVNLRIEPGEMLAVVGLNGAGKSTLIQLLAGLHRPTGGVVTADGISIWQLGIERWRAGIAIVFQDFVRYRLSAWDNVRLGRPQALEERSAIEAAAVRAGLAEVVEKLPGQWSTPLSRDRTGGVDLSGGQWQKVALARALYALRQGARLLVLDEPTAHLDVRSEAELFQRLDRREEACTIVLITHRLSTVRHADRIAVLEGGQITEIGSHDNLIARDGSYARMFRIQAERFVQGYVDRIEEIQTS